MNEEFKPLNKFPIGTRVFCEVHPFYKNNKIYEVVMFSDGTHCIIQNGVHMTGYGAGWQVFEPKSLDDYM